MIKGYHIIIFIIKWNNFKYFEPDMNNSTWNKPAILKNTGKYENRLFCDMGIITYVLLMSCYYVCLTEMTLMVLFRGTEYPYHIHVDTLFI